jgi:hypothetical protein
MSDYRPIACCNVLYKIISKIICNRIKPFLPLLISENQSAFIPGRYIAENVLLAHEQIRQFNRRGSDRMCIKIDLQKAYDMINREFICHMLNMMGFPHNLIKLIRKCISTATYSIIINGRPKGFIHSNRGLRQGDPLSPYLFCIAMEFFSLMMYKEHKAGNFQPIFNQDPCVTHLLYADDLMIFSKAKLKHAKVIKDIMRKLKDLTGLNINNSRNQKLILAEG